MPWRNVTMEEERYRFILDYLKDTMSFLELCTQYGISRKTGYKWLERFFSHGKEGLFDLSRKPKKNPTKISEDLEGQIIEIRKKYPSWGPKKIRAKLENNVINCPSQSTIGNYLKKWSLSNPRIYRKHVAKTAPLGNCNNSNDIWSYDFKGYFHTKDGSKCEPLTIIDNYSRMLLICNHMKRKREGDVWDQLELAFNAYGLPLRIRSDNGPPFASLAVGRLSRLAVKLIKLGITPEWIEPGCPQQNGRQERFHATLKRETAKPPALTLQMQELKFKQFKEYYNFDRPHEALNQKTPASIYSNSTRTYTGKFISPEYSSEFEIRKIQSSGHLTWKGKDLFISELLVAEYVGIKEVGYGEFDIYYGPIKLGHINLNDGYERC